MPFGSDLFGGLLRGSPNLPALQPINVQQEQQKAITGNQAVTGQLQNWASGINQFNFNQLQSMLNQSIPQYQQLKDQASSTISQEMAGQIPTDVSQQVQNSAAARALGGGFAGSGAHGDLVARDLGLTSLNLTQQGINSAQSWMQTVNSIEKPQLFDFSGMFVTPGQQLASDTSERNAQFQHDWNQNLINWQSSLGYLAGNDVESSMNSIMSMAGSAGGAAAGGGGGL